MVLVSGARKSQTAASFVRPNRPHDKPRSFVEALHEKYASEVDIVYIGGGHEKPATTGAGEGERAIKISGKEVEEVGFDKIRRRLADLDELRIVLLDGLAVQRPFNGLFRRAWNTPALEIELESGNVANSDPMKHPGRPTEVQDACPKIMELDLSRNLFEKWIEIVSICEELPDLRSLRCDGNRFSDMAMTRLERKYFESRFRQIHSLFLDDTLLSWTDLAECAELFSSITTLTASCNELQSLSITSLPCTLTSITLEDNKFHSLADVASLCGLPQLQKLILRNNVISRIHSTYSGPDPSAPDIDFAFSSSLFHLDVSKNAIKEWSFISALPSLFPGLTSLRISNNPLFDSLYTADNIPLTPEDGYVLTIARLAKLKTLNFSTISSKDRLNSESYYLSQIALAISRLPADVPAKTVTSQHPRYEELCEEYGEPDIVRKQPVLNPNALAARLLKLTLRYNGKEVGIIELPKRFSVYTLSGMVGRSLALRPSGLRLIWETGELYGGTSDQKNPDGPWHSDSDDDSEKDGDKSFDRTILREVELIAGTRSVGTWIDGDEAILRVETT